MSTVNISLPQKQINHIDKMVSQYGFANRSEFIRSLIRVITHEPKIVEKAAIFPFVSPKEKSVKKIISDFQRTNKYSPVFLKDLEEGLKSSDYFTQ